MSLEQYSYLAQIIGAVAVVASLIFVGVQLRQNTKAILAQTSQAHAVGYQQIIAGISDSGEFARIWRMGLADFQSLDADGRARFLAFTSTLFRFYESSQVQMLGGSLDAEHWHTIEQQVTDLVTQPGVKAWWKLRRHWHSARFRDWIDALPTQAPAMIYDDATQPASPPQT
ncbi:MAG: hypothetical protein R3C16_01450 [Hyphomonadaceae bacterium]